MFQESLEGAGAGAHAIRCVLHVSKYHEFCNRNDEFCIQNDEFCIRNEELFIKNDEFCIKNDGTLQRHGAHSGGYEF